MIIIEIAGHLGADPETRFTSSGQKVTSLRVAVNTRKSGKEETVWWRVTLWGDRFDKLLPHLKKGSAVIVIGEMNGKPEIYNDREGKPQVSLELTAEIIRFSPFGRGQTQQDQAAAGAKSAPAHASAPFQGVQEAPFAFSVGSVASGQGGEHMEDEEMPF